jgi:hypothetical protein
LLELSPLDKAQLQQAYEWDRAGEMESFDHYAARLTGGEWVHYAILDGDDFTGVLSLELIAPTTCSIHLCKRIGGDRDALRRLLIDTGIVLFRSGFTKLGVPIRRENEAATALAASCGMTPEQEDDAYRYLTLTADTYFANQSRWN